MPIVDWGYFLRYLRELNEGGAMNNEPKYVHRVHARGAGKTMETIDLLSKQIVAAEAIAARRLELLMRTQPFVDHADYCKQAWYSACDCDCGAETLKRELSEELKDEQ